MTTPQVTNYTLRAANGRIIRTATKVVFPDGREVAFTERMTKTEALRQAEAAVRPQIDTAHTHEFLVSGCRYQFAHDHAHAECWAAFMVHNGLPATTTFSEFYR